MTVPACAFAFPRLGKWGDVFGDAAFLKNLLRGLPVVELPMTRWVLVWGIQNWVFEECV